jgi:phage terminase large subunit
MPTQILLPYKFEPREYQLPMFRDLDNGVKRLVEIWHRRAGKDKSLINLVAKKMLERVGAYYYFFPTYAQGKKILWEGADRTGFRFLDHIPKELRVRTDNGEMLIELKNGSIFRVVGTDKIDSVVGTNPIGCVFSEYALQNPNAWSFIRPILQENGGWAVFNYTPRGDNHGRTLFEAAQSRDGWNVHLLTAKDTGVFTPEQLEQERRELIEEHGDAEGQALFDQEYMCSFDAPVVGSYYGSLMRQAEDQGRIMSIPYDPLVPVDTWWDLGVGDSTAIGFVQQVGNEIRAIDYYETNGEGIPHYAAVLRSKGYSYNRHIAPHDIEVRELGSGRSRREVAKEHGINFTVSPRQSLEDGIEATRILLPRIFWDKEKTEQWRSALKNYHKEFDDKKKVYRDRPEHDWSSHAADMTRYGAIAHKPIKEKKLRRRREFDPVTGRLLS